MKILFSFYITLISAFLIASQEGLIFSFSAESFCKAVPVNCSFMMTQQYHLDLTACQHTPEYMRFSYCLCVGSVAIATWLFLCSCEHPSLALFLFIFEPVVFLDLTASIEQRCILWSSKEEMRKIKNTYEKDVLKPYDIVAQTCSDAKL